MKPQKTTVHGPLLTELEEGQPYIDEPVYEVVPVFVGKQPMMGQKVRYYVRTPLTWKNRKA